MEVWSFNHWTAREVHNLLLKQLNNPFGKRIWNFKLMDDALSWPGLSLYLQSLLPLRSQLRSPSGFGAGDCQSSRKRSHLLLLQLQLLDLPSGLLSTLPFSQEAPEQPQERSTRGPNPAALTS